MKYIVEIPRSIARDLDQIYDDLRASDIFHFIPTYLEDTFIRLYGLAVDCAVTQGLDTGEDWGNYAELACSISAEAEVLFTALYDTIGRIRVNKLISTFYEYIPEDSEIDHRFPMAVWAEYDGMATRTDSRATRKANILLAISIALSYVIASAFRDALILDKIHTVSVRSKIPRDYTYNIKLNYRRRSVVLEAV